MVTWSATEQRLLLHNICWCTYRALVNDIGDVAAPRINYSNGLLEFEMPLQLHENVCKQLYTIIEILTEEQDIDCEPLGSTTMQHDSFEKGFEADETFYIQSIELLQDRHKVDLNIDPAPDLLLESDVTSPSAVKVPMYAALGVGELWWWRKGRLGIHVLENGAYQEVGRSIAFPILTADVLNDFITEAGTMRRPDWIKNVRRWVREQIAA